MGHKGEEEIIEEAKEERQSLRAREKEGKVMSIQTQFIFICKIEASKKSIFNIVIAAKYVSQ